MEAVKSNIEKLNKIANSPIPISDKDVLYDIFLHRKETAIRMLNPVSEEKYKLLEKLLEYTENLIKDFLYL